MFRPTWDMQAFPPLESILKRDRLIVLTGIVTLCLLAWYCMWREARAMAVTGACHCLGMKMSGPDMESWSTGQLLPLFLMWAEMMVAMMLPSAAPMILTFALVNRKRHEQQRPYVPASVFAAGYFVVWTAFSALATLAQWALHGFALLTSSMVLTSPLASGIILILAGGFQWTPLKHACLRHCRSPLGFLMTDWREGKAGAFFMGVKHGAFCTFCCWFLMALLFVAGVMNMWWVGLISVVVLVEKLAPQGGRIAKALGVTMATWGIWMCLGPFGGS
jgi:predicted metal-binding membrane protein